MFLINLVYYAVCLRLDVIGVAKAVGDVQTFQAKSTGREMKKREIQLLDPSNTTVSFFYS